MTDQTTGGVDAGDRDAMDVQALRQRTLDFIEAQRIAQGPVGAYRYSQAVSQPTLYSSTYAAMTRSLYNDLEAVDASERRAWIDYLNRHQDDDGLYRDPVIFDQGWYQGDPLWCGRMHLTCHVVGALACLGGVAPKPFTALAPYTDPETLVTWLAQRDWGERVAWTGNEIMNVGTLLQYARDVHHDDPAGVAVEIVLEYLNSHHLNAETGVWGSLDTRDPLNRSHAVQAAYHWWALYFYDGRPIPYAARAIDTLLATQNREGGFGCGVHNPDAPDTSSACEDIDSIDPLARLSFQTDYRRDDILDAVGRALRWVLSNQTADGGFVFLQDQPFTYGHPELLGETNAGAMFPTWFRTLSLGLIAKALPRTPIGTYPWHFEHSPGVPFWQGA